MLKNVILIVLMTVLLPKLITYSSQYFSIFMKPQLPLLYATYQGADISNRCQIIKARGLNHCEDVITIKHIKDEDTGYSPLLAGCDNRYAYNTVLGVFNDGISSGSLQLINPYKDLDNRVDATVIEIEFDDEIDFHPLGLDVSPVNKERIFIVNHAVDGSRIEVFNVDYDLARAHHVMSISDPLIKTPK